MSARRELLISYSNYGAALAGSAVSHAAGRPFEELVEGTIFEPLGMTHTTFREPCEPAVGLPLPMPSALVPDVSRAFHWTGTALEQRPYEYIGQIAPAGSVSSTAGDMARYMLLLLNEGEPTAPRLRPGRRPGVQDRRHADRRALRHGFFDQALPAATSATATTAGPCRSSRT